MPRLWTTVHRKTDEKSDCSDNARLDRSLVARTHLSGWNRSSCPGVWAVAANLRQREIRQSSPSRWGLPQKKGKLTIECDELWSFVDHKGNKQWVWLALDADTREIVGVYIGARDEAAAQKLWESLPPIYRQCAVAYTDFWAAYGTVLPCKRHQAVGKESGKTNRIERFNNTLRQRVSRLVRTRLIFFKVAREPHWCYLVFHSSLQFIITFVGLPTLEISSPISTISISLGIVLNVSRRCFNLTLRTSYAKLTIIEVLLLLSAKFCKLLGRNDPEAYYKSNQHRDCQIEVKKISNCDRLQCLSLLISD